MKLDIALKIAKKILEKTNISELKFTEAKESIYDTNTFEYDLEIVESSISHEDIQLLDEMLGDFDNVTMEVDLYHDMIRIFEVEPEEEEEEVS